MMYNQLIMQSKRVFYPQDSLRGALNFFYLPAYNPNDVMDRPPFPIINPDPLMKEVFANLNYGDLGLFLLCNVASTFAAYLCIKLPSISEPVLPSQVSLYHSIRSRLFRAFGLGFFFMNLAFPMLFSHHRLLGLRYNGQEWLTQRPSTNRFSKKKSPFTIWSKIL